MEKNIKMSLETALSGAEVSVYENRLLANNRVVVLKEERALIVGDYYTFIFKTFQFNEALDYCFNIANERVQSFINKPKKA